VPFSQSQLDKLKSAYASGVLKVRFGDQEVVYKSEEEMRRTIENLSAEINGRAGPKIKPLRTSKGLE
jgi:hypothetical protein